MNDVRELHRRTSPGGRPQPLAFYENSLWVGSWETDHIYALDPTTWSVRAEVAAPGKPYGIAPFEGGLRVVVSLGEEDDRYLYQFVPGDGFDASSKTPCPDLTGSQLASDGKTLYLGQMGNRRILALDAQGGVARELALPTRFGGMGFGPSGGFYIITADEEWENLRFAKLDLRSGTMNPDPIARIPDGWRSLAYDGSSWWTCDREAGEIVTFAAD
jgi:outer membrane protein assembly factor BamB